MAMTEDEKKAARREASRKWYAAHKASKKPVQRKRGRAKVDRPAPENSETESKPLFTADELVEEKVVSVDPSLLTGIEDGSVSMPSSDSVVDDYADDDADDAERLAELEEIDPDELTDDEREELNELRETRDDEDWQVGRFESMRELEEQGAYDD